MLFHDIFNHSLLVNVRKTLRKLDCIESLIILLGPEGIITKISVDVFTYIFLSIQSVIYYNNYQSNYQWLWWCPSSHCLVFGRWVGVPEP